MTVHLYALCWNEAPIIPYFFRHYDSFVSHYFVYDDGSSDQSVTLLKSHPRTTVAPIQIRKKPGPPSSENPGLSFVEFYNQIWKQSMGKADYVIICNMDEHFYHPQMADYLQQSKSQGITIIPSKGFDMLHWYFPKSSLPLSSLVKKGVPVNLNNKTFVFDPNQITDTGFTSGRHTMSPTGNIQFPEQTEVKMLHYHWLGLFHCILRRREKGFRMKNLFTDYFNHTTNIFQTIKAFRLRYKYAKSVI